MNSFDDDLREALKRGDPPPGFAGRVLGRVHECEAAAPRVARVRTLPWRWTAVAAGVLLAVIMGLSMYREHLQRTKGERVKQEVLLALRITGSRLRTVQERITEVQLRKIEVPTDRK